MRPFVQNTLLGAAAVVGIVGSVIGVQFLEVAAKYGPQQAELAQRRQIAPDAVVERMVTTVTSLDPVEPPATYTSDITAFRKYCGGAWGYRVPVGNSASVNCGAYKIMG